ncbi:MAG: tryptophan-rich sensory protein [Xanthomonadales bacterium]|jgi:tryptophan-rich sensory protein|nr:tryptophan-rich sensory protein [Xanthomonadales bacterium]
MHRLVSLAVFLLLVVIAAVVGGQFVGGEWYQAMLKPSWSPSAMVMASAWAVLYVLMAVSGWMIWDTMRGLARVALGLWGLQLLLGICWSWMFFGLERIGWSLGVISLWILVVVIVIKTFRPIKQEASTLMLPLAAWLIFLWVLNFFQWNMNGGGLGSIF